MPLVVRLSGYMDLLPHQPATRDISMVRYYVRGAVQERGKYLLARSRSTISVFCGVRDIPHRRLDPYWHPQES
jgi:hypothetical protein